MGTNGERTRLQPCVALAVCLVFVVGPSAWFGCSPTKRGDPQTPAKPPTVEGNEPPQHLSSSRITAEEEPANFAARRRRMVEHDLAGRDITDRRVLAAMGRVPRHQFVPADLQELAYRDHPLPIGHQQTISQPYVVALMTQLARPKPDSRALDIGTGSGYQAAILAELVEQVYSVEILRPLADSARQRLARLGHTNVDVICGDGYRGLPAEAPFDLIIVAAAPDHVPQPLVEQLASGGRMVIPVGRAVQNLQILEKLADGTVRKEIVEGVAFVPMTGEAQQSRD